MLGIQGVFRWQGDQPSCPAISLFGVWCVRGGGGSHIWCDPSFNPRWHLCAESHSAFSDTDGSIQKLKQQYNQIGGGPALEITLAEVQDDLKRRPPKALTIEELELAQELANGHLEHGPGSGRLTINSSHHKICC